MEDQAKKVHGTWSYPGKENERQWKNASKPRFFNWWLLPLEIRGMLGPLIGAVVSLVITILCMWIAKFANVIFQSEFLSMMIGAVDRNIMWFFIAPLAIGYCQYLAKKFYVGHLLFLPLGNAVGTTFSIWIIAWVIKTIGAISGVALLFQIGTLARASLPFIFALVLLLGYWSVAFRHLRAKHQP